VKFVGELASFIFKLVVPPGVQTEHLWNFVTSRKISEMNSESLGVSWSQKLLLSCICILRGV